MAAPDSIKAAVARARISRVISSLPELSEERLEAIEATLFDAVEMRAACGACGHLYRPYFEHCRICPRA
jgi:hypothetical protein